MGHYFGHDDEEDFISFSDNANVEVTTSGGETTTTRTEREFIDNDTSRGWDKVALDKQANLDSIKAELRADGLKGATLLTHYAVKEATRERNQAQFNAIDAKDVKITYSTTVTSADGVLIDQQSTAKVTPAVDRTPFTEPTPTVSEVNNTNTVSPSAKELKKLEDQGKDATSNVFDSNTDTTINPGDIARDEAAGLRALGISDEPTTEELELSDEELENLYFTETNTTTDLEMDQLMDDAEADQDFMEADHARRELDAEYNSRPILKDDRSVQELRKKIDKSDWRVRLRLAPNSDYFYNSADPGIMQPLSETDGVLFPYVPHMTQGYKANYNNYSLTHSNHRGYFYQGSVIDDMLINSTFTAQDTREANYMLATIHFFRSATKMFYGQDTQRGTPPPLLFLTGLGEYQFNEHPYVLSVFNYVLPNDVDYIKAGDPGHSATDFSQAQRSSSPKGHNKWSSKISRLFGSGLTAGAESFFSSNNIANVPGTTVPNPISHVDGVTYVPTKIEIALTLLPIQTREQVSNEFSLKDYASGKLLKKGFH